MGASNHTDKEREENDYYATEPAAAEWLCRLEDLSPRIWECACGEGHLAEVFKAHGHAVIASDLIDRGYGTGGIDFLQCSKPFDGDIITNPPYSGALSFCRKALELVTPGRKVCMFLKIQFLEGKGRKAFFEEFPPKIVHISSSRLLCAKNGEFEKMKEGGGSAVAYAWYVWEKGQGPHQTILNWFN